MKYKALRYFSSSLVLIVCISALFWGCLSKVIQPDTSSDIEEFNVEYDLDNESPNNIIVKFIEENPIQSLPLIEKFYDNEFIDESEYESYEESSIKKITKEMRQYYLGEHYDIALNYLDVLTAYVETKTLSSREASTEQVETIQNITDALDRKELLKQVILQRHKANNYSESQLKALQLLELNEFTSLDEEVVEVLLEQFPLYKHKALYAHFCESTLIDERHKTDIACGKTSEYGVSDMLDSTFIIDIDKGLSVEGISHEIGSAFFITADGYAITNHHVITSQVDKEYKGKSKMTVKLKQDNYKPRDAQVIGYDPLIDLALIKVENISDQRTFTIVDDKDILEGDPITVIGSPIGLINSVSSGILSSKSRTGLLNVGSVMQMDASVNPGNSGGPMLNSNLDVVGVVVAKIQGVENINFAIPSSILQTVLPKLFRGDRVKHSWIGVGGYLTEKGFEVLYIAPQSAAERSSLKIGDYIQAVNGVAFNSSEVVNNFRVQMLGKEINELMRLSVFRELPHSDKSPIEKEILITSSDRNNSVVFSSIRKTTFHKIFPVLTGASIEVTNFRASQPQYRITKVFAESIAEYIGFTAGDIVNIRRIMYQDNLLLTEVRVIQQSRGFLDDVFIIYLDLNTKNFI